ncbi:MAG TPA: glycosyltransferase family 4 protein [Armatimonadota bacterium]
MSPSTWSGTPRNLISALEGLGAEVVPVAAGPTSPLAWKALRAASKLRRHDVAFNPAFRRWVGRRTEHLLRGAGVDAALHVCSTSTLPPAGGGLRHALYCDSTWRRMSAQMPRFRVSRTTARRVDERERAAYARFDHLFTISEMARDSLIDDYGLPADRVTVVGTGRGRIEPYHGEKDYSSGIVLFACKHAFDQKGGPLLLEGFRLAQRRLPGLSLVVVGPKELEARVAGVPGVRVTGFLPWEELQELFHTASLFAMPAPYEPWGLVYLEALACRTPLLGLNRNAMPELTGQGRFGFLVDEPTPQAVADGLVCALADPGRLEEMGRLGQEHCLATYSWERTAGAILSTLSRGATVEAVP